MATASPLEETGSPEPLRGGVQFFEGPLGVIPNPVRSMARRPETAAAITARDRAVSPGNRMTDSRSRS